MYEGKQKHHCKKNVDEKLNPSFNQKKILKVEISFGFTA